MITKEVWRRTVRKGYRVSSHGRVKSIDRTMKRSDGVIVHLKGKILKPGLAGKDRNRPFVFLGAGHKHNVHTLVLLAFVGPKPPGHECCHYPDRDPRNNRTDNLRWGTKKENHQDSVKHGTAKLPEDFPQGERNGNAKLTEVEVRKIRHCRNVLKQPLKQIAKRFKKVRVAAISKIARGDLWKEVD